MTQIARRFPPFTNYYASLGKLSRSFNTKQKHNKTSHEIMQSHKLMSKTLITTKLLIISFDNVRQMLVFNHSNNISICYNLKVTELDRTQEVLLCENVLKEESNQQNIRLPVFLNLPFEEVCVKWQLINCWSCQYGLHFFTCAN